MGIARNIADAGTLRCSPRASASVPGDGVCSSYPQSRVTYIPVCLPKRVQDRMEKWAKKRLSGGSSELWVCFELFWCSHGFKFISVKALTLPRAVCCPFPGFTLWGSAHSWNWNAVDEGPKRDIVKELEVAVRNRTDLHFGLYYSLFEWFHPLFLEDQSSAFQKQRFPVAKTLPELYELVTKYQPEVLWSDGDGGAPDHYWNSTDFLAWLYNESPVRDTVVTNDRWGAGSICKHGGYYTCSDRYNPGHLLPHKWENCMTIDKFSWGYRREAEIGDYLTIEELVKQLVETVSCGGNLLMNIGPTLDGIIPVIFEERLRQMGTWLKVNGEAIYETHTWRSQNDTVTPDVWYTSKPEKKLVYAIFLKWPISGKLFLGQPIGSLGETEVELLGHGRPLTWTSSKPSGIVVELPRLSVHQMPCKWGWTLALINVT